MHKIVVLVDYENVKPNFSNVVLGPEYEVKVFLSKHCCELKGEVAPGLALETIKTEAKGKNALDFHLVYYLGQSAAKNPNNSYIILSHDKGFDTIANASPGGVQVTRRDELPGLLMPQAPPTDDERLIRQWANWLTARWLQLGSNQPKTLKAFNAYMYPQLAAALRKAKMPGKACLERLYTELLTYLGRTKVLSFPELQGA